MSEIDTFTKRKPPNAYVLFTTAFINQYKAEHPNDYRFHGGLSKAIKDPMVMQTWDVVSPETKQFWKERAKEEKRRLLNEFAYRVEQYVFVKDNESESMPEAETNDESSNMREMSGGTSTEPTQPLPELSTSVRASSIHLKRLLRPKKKRRNTEESKYAPSFFDEITTAGQFEEKRRRERSCLIEVWGWRSEMDKDAMLDEPFLLVSSKPSHVLGGMYAPGTISCLEFTLRDGIKRVFCCNVAENYTEWANGAIPGLYEELDCNSHQPPGPVCRELSKWLRASRKDISSKTPIFFCLVEEYAETFDCLNILFSYKGGSSKQFQPYLLATTDDLITSLLQFFDVPWSFENAATPVDDQPIACASGSQPQAVPFPLSSIIDQYYVETAKIHACEFHRNEIVSMEQSADGGDGYLVDKDNRCPLAVVRTCVAYAKQWIEKGRVNDGIQITSPKSVDQAYEPGKPPQSYAESMQSEDMDMDRFSYLKSSIGDGSDRTVGTGTEGGSVKGRNVYSETDSSEDIIEMNTPGDVSAETRPAAAAAVVVAKSPTIAAQPTSVRLCTIAEASAESLSRASSRGSTVKRTRSPTPMPHATALASQHIPIGLPSGVEGGGVGSDYLGWSAEFRRMYEAQQRLPNGCRGLGRGMNLN